MKKLLPLAVMSMMLPMLAFALPTPSSHSVASSAPHEKTYRGQIMDSACAKEGSHTQGYKMTGTDTPKACTLACVHGGSTFVLYNGNHKTTYKLDNQNDAKPFAGENVKVMGTLNKSDDTIHVDKIKAA